MRFISSATSHLPTNRWIIKYLWTCRQPRGKGFANVAHGIKDLVSSSSFEMREKDENDNAVT